MHRNRIALLCALAAASFAGPVASQAETFWSVVEGKAALLPNESQDKGAGLRIEMAGSQGPIARIGMGVSPASTMELATSRGTIERFAGGDVEFDVDMVIGHGKTLLVVDALRLRPAVDSDGYLFAGNIDGREEMILFELQAAKTAFGRVAARMLIEVGEVVIARDLAARLDSADLAGEVVASFHADIMLAWSGGDDPEYGPSSEPRGGSPRAVCTYPTYGPGPDVIVGSLPGISNYTSEGGIEALAIGTTSCNLGDAELSWISGNNQHPVIGQSLYRLTNMPDGSSRFEHIGQSWLKHGFAALQGAVCCDNCISSGTGSRLGVGCSDPYSSSLNGSQGNLGPKWEVNAHTGAFVYPYTDSSGSGSIYKRVQVAISDIDPAQNGGDAYFGEGHYIAPDDATAGNGNNNASYRPISITGSGAAWTFSVTGTTQREQAGIRAWQDTDPSVVEVDVQIPNEGLIIVASDATDLGGGIYHYEYAVHNINSDRSVGSFTVPVPAGATVSNIGFHDVDYHSGEPFDGTDWPGAHDAGLNVVTWATTDYATNANANALRWGTLYSFRFDVDVAPSSSQVTLGLFKPGSPTSVTTVTTGPNAGPIDCQPNGVDDADDITNGTSMDCNGNYIPDECETFPTCTLGTVRVATGLTRPVAVTSPPGDFDRLFITEQPGFVQILNLTTYAIEPVPFLDIDALVGGGTSGGDERGFFSIAFHPNYAVNGLFYVNYTNNSGATVIAQYSVSAGDPNLADPGSAVVLRTIGQPYSNHNGGQLQFGPDGMLYTGMGDGGNGGDPGNRSQDDTTLLGKMLRLDVDNAPTYEATGNPGGGWLADVWAKGLRNPWRFSFDRLTGDLYIGDVGQNAWEEIDFQPAASTGGENYGWRCYEGNAAFNTAGCGPAGDYDFPILDYPLSGGNCTVIGGYVYRGCDIPWLSGTYFYADYCANWIKTFRYDGATLTDQQDRTADLAPAVGSLSSIVSFGEDATGELYITTLGGSVFKIVCEGAGGAICGNGIIETGEECDDGNATPGDGCFNCQLEDNDACADAVPIYEEDTPFDTTAATTDGATHGSCQYGGVTGNDIWFTYQAPCDGNLAITTCEDIGGSATYDTDLVLYTGCDCGTMTLLACNDDDTGHPCGQSFPWRSTIENVPVTAGQCYMIRVGGYLEGSVGTGVLRITNSGSPCSSCGDGILDPGEECDDANGDPNDGCDNCVITGNVFRGGKLYDKWWLVSGVPAPVGDHPLWSRQATNTRTGSATWRCKECHGWDYKGAGGAYGSGSHFTGFVGVLGSAMTPTEMFNLLKNPESPADPGGHGYGAAGVDDVDIANLVVFLQTMLIDTDPYITFATKAFNGDAVAGQTNYNTTGTCATCHGADGTIIDFDAGPGVEWVGTIAWNNPWELMHKVRIGQPGTVMPSYLDGLGNDQDVADIGKYAQSTFSVECTSGIHCDDGIPCTTDSCDGRFCVYTPSPADGDFDGIGGANGLDIQPFVDAIINGATAEDECHGDFDGINSVDVGDIPGMVTALLAP